VWSGAGCHLDSGWTCCHASSTSQQVLQVPTGLWRVSTVEVVLAGASRHPALHDMCGGMVAGALSKLAAACSSQQALWAPVVREGRSLGTGPHRLSLTRAKSGSTAACGGLQQHGAY
jgi:hypothetical protein